MCLVLSVDSSSHTLEYHADVGDLSSLQLWTLYAIFEASWSHRALNHRIPVNFPCCSFIKESDKGTNEGALVHGHMLGSDLAQMTLILHNDSALPFETLAVSSPLYLPRDSYLQASISATNMRWNLRHYGCVEPRTPPHRKVRPHI